MRSIFRGILSLSTMLAGCAVLVVPEAAAETRGCTRGKIETRVNFKNDRSSTVTYHWVDAKCREVAYGDIQPGGEATVSTYAAEVWRVRDKGSGRLLRDVAASMPPLAIHVGNTRRNTHEREDDLSDFLVKVMYVLPQDGVDRQLDTDGAIVLSVAAMQQWLVQQTGGRRLRFATHEGALDIGFARLKRTEAALKGHKARIRDEIESELANLGFRNARKLYLVYYDGDATECGGGPSVTKPGSVAAIYLRGRQGQRNPCGQTLAESVDRLTFNEYGALHEIVHALGFVAACAPNHTKPRVCPDRRRVTPGHVSDDPRDLMYAGCKSWRPAALDIGRNDYFMHRNAGCLDLNNSVFLEPPAEPPPGWK